jgi:hypothetical protein
MVQFARRRLVLANGASLFEVPKPNRYIGTGFDHQLPSISKSPTY